MESKTLLQQEQQGQGEISIAISSTKLQEKWKVIGKLILFTGLGVAGRVALQYLPSVEPITALAIAFAYFFGITYGIIPGALGFWISNFLVWGGQGPWTIFQIAGVSLAAVIAGVIGKATQSRKGLLIATGLGVAAYEFTVDLSWVFTFGDLNPITVFILPLPFSITHLLTSLGFSLTLYEAREKLLDYLKGEMNEIKVLVSRYSPSIARNLGIPSARVNAKLTIRKHYNDKQISFTKWMEPEGKFFKRDSKDH